MLDDRELDHFIDLARRGRQPGSSGGEKRAYRLCKSVLADVPGLDFDAQYGLALFIFLTSQDYPKARERAGVDE